MNWYIDQTIDLKNPDVGKRTTMTPLAVVGDSDAHTWRMTVLNGGAAYSLTGMSAVGSFIRPDGTTVVVNGSVSGNVASVTLSDACYTYPGALKCILRVLDDGAVMAAGAMWLTVEDGGTNTIVAAEGVVPDITNIMAEYAAMEAAVTAASSAAETAIAAASSITGTGKSTMMGTWTPAASYFTFKSGGINPSTGKDTSSALYARTGYIYRTRAIRFELTNSDYKYTIYEYKAGAQSGSNPYRSDTNGSYVTGSTVIPYDGTVAQYFRVAVTRVSGENDITESEWTNTIVPAMKFYAATDKTLTEENAAADAKATGEALAGKEPLLNQELESGTDADDLTENGYYWWASANTPTNAPSTLSGAGMLVTYKANSTICYQAIWGYSSANVWTRVKKTNTWTDWARMETASEVNEARFLTKKLPQGSDTKVNPNSITENGWYYWANNATFESNTMPFDSGAGQLINRIAASGSAVSPAYQTVIQYATGRIWTRVRKGAAFTAWEEMASTASVSEAARKCYVRCTKNPEGYADGSKTSDDPPVERKRCFERLLIYIPAATGYLEIMMYHMEDRDEYVEGQKVDPDSNNCDGWQLFNIYHVDNVDRKGETGLTRYGEWECALHLDGREDFSGGHTHGDELLPYVDPTAETPVPIEITILVDGAPKTLDDLGELTGFRELRLMQPTLMYDPADHTTVICEHGKEWVFTADGFTVNQSILWKVSDTLTNCYLAMALPLKGKVNRAYVDTEQKTITLAESGQSLSSIVKQGVKEVTMYGPNLALTVRAHEYPTGYEGGDRISFGDNGGNSYNKLYFKIAGAGSIASGTLWRSTVEYKLRYS